MHGHTEELIHGASGKLFVRSWLPEGSPRAVIAICHGFNAHSGMYLGVGRRLASLGISALALDLRGRGRSDGERAYVADLNDYSEDVGTLVELARTRFPGRPIFLLGHCIGGVAGCLYVLDQGRDLAGFICESLALQLPVFPVALRVARAMSHVWPRAPLVAIDNRHFARDWTFVATMNADPLVRREVQPVATVAALARASERLGCDFSGLKVPTLIVHGTADRATRPTGSQLFYDRAGSPDKTIKLYHGRFHDLFNDWGGEEVLDHVVRWVEERL